MVGALLTQNTAWVNVEKAIVNLKNSQLLSSSAILNIADKRLAELIRPSGYFNIKTKRLKALCAWYEQRGGFEGLSELSTEVLREELLTVHGVGPETADDIVLYAFKRPVFVIDAYTRRLLVRLGFANGKEDYDSLKIMIEKALDYNTQDMNEFHALIVIHAKDHCKKVPACGNCPLSKTCDFFMGNAALLGVDKMLPSNFSD